jgi:hypothetical protein
MALAGCGAERDGSPVGAPPQPRVIAHKFGETRISGVPRRIVTVGLAEQDYDPVDRPDLRDRRATAALVPALDDGDPATVVTSAT